ncbi:class I SAM-dependent methyltransferase [Pseudomarimonas salicorniae]|uniref:Methyltransferase domain-containing protein n=1 Tax=Pseudomarimonas salicorniae TaxID=2933270 RepID=A0ABT0GLK2_9GAMM|nr:methyltransferase domain-containing protein [Lysobacter sp. CAU 1642]MCK7595428.1 methyltransferase domain-containing protein [Lysobacter sp. CAU 1642]
MKLSIGAGERRIEGFLSVDIDAALHPDIVADIGRPLDLPDASVECLFCEEVISQIAPEACLGFFRECRRILQPGGVVRILTPDLARFTRAYLERPDWLREIWHRHVGLPLLCDTAAEVLNLGLRGVGPFVYDRATLRCLANSAGLVLHESAFNESLHPAMRGLDMRGPEETLTMYLELTVA